MRRWIRVICIVVVALTVPVYASAQGGPMADASADSSAASPASAATAIATATPHPTESATPDAPPRPVRGPAVRERAGRRSRGGSVASGALMLFMLIAFMGYYVVKKLRR